MPVVRDPPPMNTPTKANSPSSIRTDLISIKATTTSVGRTLGKMCRVTIPASRTPTTRAPSMKGRSRMAMNSARTVWATSPQPTKQRAIRKATRPRRMSGASIKIMPARSIGRADMASTMPITLRSGKVPARQPATAPSAVPSATRTIVTNAQAFSVFRAPYKSRLSMSRPQRSVPSGHSADGAKGGEVTSPRSSVRAGWPAQ